MRISNATRRWGLVSIVVLSSRRLLLAVALLSALCAASSCNDDGPTGPGTAKDYPVYFLDGVDHTKLYRYHPAVNRLDSILLPFEIRWGYELSPHGDMLYACGWDSLYIVELSSDTPQVVDFIPGRFRGGAAVSNDGQLLALCGFDLQIVRTIDHSLVFSDTDQTFGGVFSPDDQRFYAVGWVEVLSIPYPVYRVNLNDTTDVLRRTFPDNPIHRVPLQIVPAPNDRRLLIYFSSASFEHSFEVYDEPSDSVIFREELVPGAGRITLHPNGRFAYYTNPGTLLVGPVPPSEFYRFSLEQNDKDRVISTSGAFDDSRFYWWPVSEVAITPDGNWLVATDWGGFDELLAYNLRTSSFAHFGCLNRGVSLQELKCQRQL